MPVKHLTTATGGDAAGKIGGTQWNESHTIDTFELAADISPAALAAANADYSPTGLATASVLRLTSTDFAVISGLAGGSDGRLIVAHNVGSYPIQLAAESAASSAANRFAFAYDLTLWPGESLWLQYDSTASRWRQPNASQTPSDLCCFDLADEFLLTGAEAGEIGQLGWNQSAAGTAVISHQDGTAEHPGITRVQSGTTSGNNTRIHLGGGQAMPVILATQVSYFGFLVRVPTITTLEIRIGLGQDLSAANFGSAGVFFEFNPTGSANWRTYTRAASTNDGPTDTTVAVTANNWYLLEALRIPSSGNWEFFINRVRRTTHSTQKPAVALNVGAIVQTGAAAARNVDIDWFRLRPVVLGQRWT
jgi:hypothetical protein